MVERAGFFKRTFSRIKILDRYLITEVAGPFIFGMVGFVIIGMVDIVFTLIDMFINNGIPFLIVLKLLIYKIPAIMVLFFPMAVLFATLIVLIRLAKDSELTVLRAGGIALGRIALPILFAGFMAFGLSFFTNEKVVPWANNVSDELIRKAVLKKPSAEIIENTFFKESENRYFYIKKIDKNTNAMENITMYEMTQNYPRVISAKKATSDGKVWQLENGIIHSYNPDGLVSYQGKFERMTIYVDEDLYNYYKGQKSPREMSSKELKEKIGEMHKGGVETGSLKVEYYMKYSVPMACFIFALTGTALTLLFIRNSKDLWGVIAAVLTALLSVGFYFFVMATFRSLGRGGMISPIMGAWGPNLIYGILAMLILGYQSKTR